MNDFELDMKIEYKKASIIGCCNRMFISDNRKEIDAMFVSAVHYLSVIHRYGDLRFTLKDEQ